MVVDKVFRWLLEVDKSFPLSKHGAGESANIVTLAGSNSLPTQKTPAEPTLQNQISMDCIELRRHGAYTWGFYCKDPAI